MSMVNAIIDGKKVCIESGSTILAAATKIGIDIPTLCHLQLKESNIVNQCASCRICVVEVEGRRNLAPACVTPITQGMVITTHSMKVLQSRKMVLELMLSDHPNDCLTCNKASNCELQDLAKKFGIRHINIGKDGAKSLYKKDMGPSIVRDMDKCIMCRRCESVCNEVQTVGALSGINRGFEAVVSTAFEAELTDTVCTQCGQCVAVCPTGALSEKEQSWDVIRQLSDPDKIVIVQTAPAIRVALGEAFGMEPGTLVTGKMVSALKQLGFDYVFDTDFAADVTIMEESAELIERITKLSKEDMNARIPILTSCCPAWVNFLESQFPDLLEFPSSAKSPQQMFGALAKSYFAEKLGVKRDTICVVSIMPCLAKKYEADREEFGHDVDFVLSTRELADLIKQSNIDFVHLEDTIFDALMGESTGASVLFGTTGGVMEAALRTAYEKIMGKELEKIVFEELRGNEGIRSAAIEVGDLTLNVGIAHGLGHARTLLESIREGNPHHFHAIEVMACPGGCIGGGGQPYHHGNEEIVQKRREALFREDENKGLRKSHLNPSVIKLYDEYLGHPLSHKAHELLHTHYTKKNKL